MTKQDWMDVLSTTSSRDWTDWLLITASILSPIVALLTAIYASKSAKAAEKAANLTLKMYEEQKEDHEKSFLPLYTVDGWTEESLTSVHFKLINKNITPVSFVEAKSQLEDFEYIHFKDKDELSFSISHDFKNEEEALFEVHYDALNHHRYKSEIKLAIKDYDVVIVHQNNIKLY